MFHDSFLIHKLQPTKSNCGSLKLIKFLVGRGATCHFRVYVTRSEAGGTFIMFSAGAIHYQLPHGFTNSHLNDTTLLFLLLHNFSLNFVIVRTRVYAVPFFFTRCSHRFQRNYLNVQNVK